MKNIKRTPEDQNKLKKEMLELINSIISSRIELTTHREIACWSIAAFYVTALIAIYKYLFDNSGIVGDNIVFIMISIFIFFFVVVMFIHSQYGAHVSSRTEYFVCVKKMFEIINGEENLNFENCKVIGDRTFYPKFIQTDIKKITKEAHKLSKIGPWIIYVWFCKRIFISMTIFISKKPGRISSWAKSLDEDLEKYGKIQLIESSIYNIILITTLLFIINLFKIYSCITSA